jgi:uncharacterized protein (UPF0335 family)
MTDMAAPIQTTISMTHLFCLTCPSAQGGAAQGLRVHRPAARKPQPREESAMNDSVIDTTSSVAAEELRQLIERFERLEAEKKDIADAQKEVMAEAKGRGYDTKVLRKIIAIRKRDANDLAEEEAVMDLYMSALGMS